jgi:hypothetical protein
VAAKL